MTGEDHLREAERLIEQSGRWADQPKMAPAEQIARRMADLEQAQVHATLYSGSVAASNHHCERDRSGAPNTKLIPGGQYL